MLLWSASTTTLLEHFKMRNGSAVNRYIYIYIYIYYFNFLTNNNNKLVNLQVWHLPREGGVTWSCWCWENFHYRSEWMQNTTIQSPCHQWQPALGRGYILIRNLLSPGTDPPQFCCPNCRPYCCPVLSSLLSSYSVVLTVVLFCRPNCRPVLSSFSVVLMVVLFCRPNGRLILSP